MQFECHPLEILAKLRNILTESSEKLSFFSALLNEFILTSYNTHLCVRTILMILVKLLHIF